MVYSLKNFPSENKEKSITVRNDESQQLCLFFIFYYLCSSSETEMTSEERAISAMMFGMTIS